MKGDPGDPGTAGPIGPRGLPGPPGFCEHEPDIGGSGEGSGEMEEDWNGLMPTTTAGARLKGTKGEKGQKV